MTTIKLKNGSGAPATSDLVQGEPALDLTNKRLYTEDSGGSVIEVGTNPTSLTTGTFTSTGIDDNATSTAITLDSSQNVGIGTTSPAQPLEILKTSAGAVVPMLQLRNGDATAGSGTSIKFMHSTVSNATSGTCELESIRYSGNYGALTFKTSSNTGVVTERMRIDGVGNVGIGETSPQGTLHVKSGDSTGTASSAGDELVVEHSSANGGISILAPNTSTSYLLFGDSDNNDVGAIGYAHSTNNLTFTINASEAMRIDSSGNVGIGTASPNGKLDITGSGNTDIYLNTGNNSGDNNRVFFGDTADIDVGYLSYDHGTNTMSFGVNASERMRIDSSGNLIIGKTTTALTTAGVALQPNGELLVTRDSGPTAYFNREGTDGDVIVIRNDNVTVGSIGNDSTALTIGSGSTGVKFGTSAVWATTGGATNANGTKDLGAATVRWKDLYLSGGAYIGGTGSANYLDDYEEGTFTVTPTFGTSGSATLDRDLLSYTKIGQVVYITGQIEFDVLSSPTGALTINIPFAVKSAVGSDRETNSFFVCKFQSLNAAPPTGSDGDQVWVTPSSSIITIQFYNGYTNTVTNIDGTYLKSASRLTITGWYLAA